MAHYVPWWADEILKGITVSNGDTFKIESSAVQVSGSGYTAGQSYRPVSSRTYAIPGISPDTMKALDTLLWIEQFDQGWDILTIQGSIKPDLTALTPAELRRGFLESYEQITDILDQAELDLIGEPGVEIMSHMGSGVQARVRIELSILY
jgi:hypothetical protein